MYKKKQSSDYNYQIAFFYVVTLCLGIILNSLIKKNKETENAQRSVTGVAYIIPSIPKKCERINNIGISTISCLVKAIVTPIFGFPIAEKKVELEI